MVTCASGTGTRAFCHSSCAFCPIKTLCPRKTPRETTTTRRTPGKPNFLKVFKQLNSFPSQVMRSDAFVGSLRHARGAPRQWYWLQAWAVLLPQCSLQCFQGPGGRCILLAQSAQGMVLGLSHERSPFLPLSTLPPFFAFGYSIDKWPTSLT